MAGANQYGPDTVKLLQKIAEQMASALSEGSEDSEDSRAQT
jgi:hypothetical protein